MTMKHLRLRVLVCCLSFGSALPVTAQSLPDWAAPAPPPAEGPAAGAPMAANVPVLPGEPTQVPVNGGLSLLALVGVGYAARKLRTQATA